MLISNGNNGIMIIPDSHSEPKLCPNCKKEELKKIICSHCGYEYVDNPIAASQVVSFILIIAFAFWLLLTCIIWWSDIDTKTFWSVLCSQGEWLSNLKIW